MVAGGRISTANPYSPLTSTEIFTKGSSSWTDVGPLPYAVFGLKGVSLENKIFMTGKIKAVP